MPKHIEQRGTHEARHQSGGSRSKGDSGQYRVYWRVPTADGKPVDAHCNEKNQHGAKHNAGNGYHRYHARHCGAVEPRIMIEGRKCSDGQPDDHREQNCLKSKLSRNGKVGPNHLRYWLLAS